MELPAERALAVVRTRSHGGPVPEAARIALHFHPDRDVLGAPVLERIVDDGGFWSQFVTRTSNGGLTARSGGDRFRWEHRIFGGAYDGVSPEDRPVYGALALDGDPYGPAPRFGSAFVRLRRDVMPRTTFCYPDSTFAPTAFGVADRAGLVDLLIAEPREDPLDRYVEAQVHGGVALDDVEALVLDPCHRSGELPAIAASAGLAVEWHPGYRLTVAELRRHSGYRGEQTIALGERLSVDGLLTPAELGAVRGDPGIDARHLKQLWHVLARFGRARR